MSHFIFCGTLSMWSLYPHLVTRFEDSLLLIVCQHQCSIDSFQPYAVPIDHIGWCCSRGHIILWRDIVPVYCFRYGTPLSSGDPFYSSVTSLEDAVTRGDVCTAELKSDSPLISLSVRISASRPHSQKSTFSWLTTLIASCQGRYRQMANRARPQSITVKKWALLQWVISIATRCHVCLTFKAPFNQCTGAGSIDLHYSHSLMTVFTAALETPEQSVSQNKVSA